MKLLKIAGVAAVVIGWLAVGLLVARGPQPEIIVPAEVITTVGPLNLTNTLITSWVVMAIIIIISLLATRSMKLIPSGIQNFVEAVIAFLVGQVEEIAGEKNGRRFFMVVATIFIYVIVNNWFGLMPFFGAIGKTEDVNHHVIEEIYEHAHEDKVYEEREHHAAWFMDNTSGMTVAKNGAKAVKFEIHAGDSAGVATDRYIIFLAEVFTDYKGPEDHEAAPSEADVRAALEALEADPDAPKVHFADAHAAEDSHSDDEHASEAAGGGHHAIPSAALSAEVEHIEFPGQKLGLVIPFFRGTFSDVNNTLAMGIVAFLCIEFWGFQALGFGYLKKFFNLNGIMSFVGILELLSEFIRVISFAFRLFGNVFAGEVLILMLTFLMPFLFVDIIYGLELFVGFIQASVFALLTLVFAVGAVEHHGDEDHHDGHEGGEADAHHGGHHETGAVQAH